MDPPTELRGFLSTRRARLSPAQAGMAPFPGMHRVPGLHLRIYTVAPDTPAADALEILRGWADTSASAAPRRSTEPLGDAEALENAEPLGRAEILGSAEPLGGIGPAGPRSEA